MNTKRLLWLAGSLVLSQCLGGIAFADPVCDSYKTKELFLQKPELMEISGMALASNGRFFWGIQDSGGKAGLFLFNRAGAVMQTYTISSIRNRDWEDLDKGPCEPGSKKMCIYIADLGNNNSSAPGKDDHFYRKNQKIYSVEEPEIPEDPEYGATFTLKVKDSWAVTFPEIPDPKEVGWEVTNPDSESLMVDPVTADIYFLSKQSHGKDKQRLFRISRTGDDAGKVVEIGAYEFTSEMGKMSSTFNAVTAANFAPDGKRFAIRTYAEIYEYDLEKYPDIAEAFQHPERRIVSAETQGETLIYDRDGYSFVTTQEAFPRKRGIPTMTYHTCQPDGIEPGDELETYIGAELSDYSTALEPDYALTCTPKSCSVDLYPLENGLCPEGKTCSALIGIKLSEVIDNQSEGINDSPIYVERLTEGFEITKEGYIPTNANGQISLMVVAGEAAQSGEIRFTTSEDFSNLSTVFKVNVSEPDPVEDPGDDPGTGKDPGDDPGTGEEPGDDPGTGEDPGTNPGDNNPTEKPSNPDSGKKADQEDNSSSCQGNPYGAGLQSVGGIGLLMLLGAFLSRRKRGVTSRKAR